MFKPDKIYYCSGCGLEHGECQCQGRLERFLTWIGIKRDRSDDYVEHTRHSMFRRGEDNGL